MSEASPSLGGSVAQLPHYAIADRVTGERAWQQTGSAGSDGRAASQDPVDYSGIPRSTASASPTLQGPSSRQARRGHAGGTPVLPAERDSSDLTDFSHSLGDGARYAVDVGRARGLSETSAARAAKLRLRQALHGVRRVCEQAMRQRMHTEMADLASQIRKMHDRDHQVR